MKVDSIVPDSHESKEASICLVRKTFFHLFSACDFVNSSNARHGNCIPLVVMPPSSCSTYQQNNASMRLQKLRPKFVTAWRPIFGDVWQPKVPNAICATSIWPPKKMKRMATWRFQDLWHGGFRVQDYFHVFSSIRCRSLKICSTLLGSNQLLIVLRRWKLPGIMSLLCPKLETGFDWMLGLSLSSTDNLSK